VYWEVQGWNVHPFAFLQQVTRRVFESFSLFSRSVHHMHRYATNRSAGEFQSQCHAAWDRTFLLAWRNAFSQVLNLWMKGFNGIFVFLILKALQSWSYYFHFDWLLYEMIFGIQLRLPNKKHTSGPSTWQSTRVAATSRNSCELLVKAIDENIHKILKCKWWFDHNNYFPGIEQRNLKDKAVGSIWQR